MIFRHTYTWTWIWVEYVVATVCNILASVSYGVWQTTPTHSLSDPSHREQRVPHITTPSLWRAWVPLSVLLLICPCVTVGVSSPHTCTISPSHQGRENPPATFKYKYNPPHSTGWTQIPSSFHTGDILFETASNERVHANLHGEHIQANSQLQIQTHVKLIQHNVRHFK